MNWLPGINLLLVATECAGFDADLFRKLPGRPNGVADDPTTRELFDDPIAITIDLQKVHVITYFGGVTHHSKMSEAWDHIIAGTRDLPERPFVVHTESPTALNYIPLPGCEWVDRVVRLTRRGFVHLTGDEKRRVINAYDVGIQSIAEILITKGLW